MDIQINDEEEIRACRREHINEMKREKEKQRMQRERFRKAAPFAAALIFLVFAGVLVLPGQFRKDAGNAQTIESTDNASDMENASDTESAAETGTETDAVFPVISIDTEPLQSLADAALSVGAVPPKIYSAEASSDVLQLYDSLKSGDTLYSENVVLVDLSENSIVAQKGAFDRINPASMTKVLTVLVAAEHIKNLDDTFTMTLEITDYGYMHDCSSAGFEKDETITVRDLFYGTVLPSGADAAVGLATYVAGSQEAFVELMNQKLEELGLADTAHMTNCVGIYDENHYCTVYDMAMIMEAAIDNDLCREVLSAHIYTTSETEQHPEGIELSNWFLRRIEDKDSGGEVICGKTGYVVQSKNCAVSYDVDENGTGFVCVTAGAGSVWQCIYDHAGLYKQFSTAAEGGTNNDTQ
ncbi:MAG: D-alanyl-D-alanine carboxypeptidase [Lachnospiraceae bacterium]|nr:D-alanyl-D-alanine carboxypeptidase [Lachnospiraceae bacterium]